MRVQVGLFVLTVMTTTIVGATHYLGFTIEFAKLAELLKSGNIDALSAPSLQFYLRGLWYSLTILAILGCHEMGHYVACLRYDIVATRPYFLPLPPIDPLTLTGTLGAFIRIKSRIPDRIALFDVGIAGPLAGFVVAVPALFIGVALSRVDRVPSDMIFGLTLGEPLLFQFAQWTIWGPIADGYALNMHPMAFAAWFGLLATALNLFPIAQLDGGHIAFAVFGRRSVLLTYVMIAVAVGLAFFSLSWIVWTILMLVMIRAVGAHHPPTLNDDIALGTGRLVFAGVALLIWIVCFTPAPISPWEPEPQPSEHRERIDVDRDALGELWLARNGEL
ncbi:MAG TPA: site-2 protease family protein [Steroidobacteraceae bacterium]|nr:site-2 protease family protein [Steroidobacteraceae bacterium]